MSDLFGAPGLFFGLIGVCILMVMTAALLDLRPELTEDERLARIRQRKEAARAKLSGAASAKTGCPRRVATSAAY